MVPHMQTLFVHRSDLVAQTLPHIPQLFLSLVTLAQMPLQQVVVPMQTLPQAPQFMLSEPLTAMHAPLHSTSPAFGHLQTPARQVDGASHTVPQAPQLAASVLVSMHMPSHILPPSAQPHDPETQVSGSAHATPHFPQFALSNMVSTHMSLQQDFGALHGAPPHFAAGVVPPVPAGVVPPVPAGFVPPVPPDIMPPVPIVGVPPVPPDAVPPVLPPASTPTCPWPPLDRSELRLTGSTEPTAQPIQRSEQIVTHARAVRIFIDNLGNTTLNPIA